MMRGKEKIMKFAEIKNLTCILFCLRRKPPLFYYVKNGYKQHNLFQHTYGLLLFRVQHVGMVMIMTFNQRYSLFSNKIQKTANNLCVVY